MIGGDEHKNHEMLSADGKDQALKKPVGSCMLVAFAALLFWLPALFMELGRQVFHTAENSGPNPQPTPDRCTESVGKDPEQPSSSASLIYPTPDSTKPSSPCIERDKHDLKLPTRSGWPFASFLIAMASGLAFIFAYWTDQPTAALSASLAIFFCGIGVTLIL